MERKEVIVAGETFNLGLKGLEEAVARESNGNRVFQLEVDTTIFQVGVSRLDKAFVLHWVGRTNLGNVVWMRFVYFRLGWPPVKSVSCFKESQEMIR